MTVIYGIGVLLSWLLMGAFLLVMFLLGLVIVPIAAVCRAFEPAKSNRDGRDIVAWSVPLIWLWGNDEDGVIAGRQYKDFKSDIVQAIYWSAIRNPVNNHRFVPVISAKIKPEDVRFVGTFGDWRNPMSFETKAQELNYQSAVKRYDTKVPQFFLCRYKGYTNLYWQFKMRFSLYIPFTRLGYFKGDLVRFWIGWKVYPTDIFGLKETDYRKHGAGFAVQFKRILKA